MELNMGLTQALSDGRNTYIYGNGRIAQAQGGTTEYFLGDALGSVRQMASTSAEVTYARGYDPYGAVSLTSGSSQTSYGHTGEYTGDYTQLLYLRARFYSPDSGRFLTKDSWLGDYNMPMSLNLWNYVQSNPVNYTDPTGHDRCWAKNEFDYVTRTDFAEGLVDRDVDGYIIRDYLNTYTAGGIGVQCYGTDFNNPFRPGEGGEGPGQVSDKQKDTPYGQPAGDNNGDGLRCYVTHRYDCACLDKKSIPDDYKLEPKHNQKDNTWAAVYMKRRIKLVTDKCEEAGCTSTDIFIAAALA